MARNGADTCACAMIVPIQEHLHVLADVPRMSTWTIGSLLNGAVAQLAPDTCYVNIGVWHGFSFLAGLIENPNKLCIGVDNYSLTALKKRQETGSEVAAAFTSRFNKFRSPLHQFFQMDYAEYLTTVHTAPIGLYFYDGDHAYEHQLKGLQLAEPFFAKGCLIIVDDTNWRDVRKATKDFIKGSANTYQVLLDQPTVIPSHPVWWNGLMILQLM